MVEKYMLQRYGFKMIFLGEQTTVIKEESPVHG